MFDQIKNDPSPKTVRLAMYTYRRFYLDMVAKWRDRKIPFWAYHMLASECEAAMIDALSHLPGWVVRADDLFEHIERVVDASVEDLIKPLEGDRRPLTPTSQPTFKTQGQWNRQSYKQGQDRHPYHPDRRPRERGYFVESSAEDQEAIDQWRADLQEREAEFFKILASARSKSLRIALGMLWQGARLSDIFAKTHLSGPRIKHEYEAERDWIKKQSDQAA